MKHFLLLLLTPFLLTSCIGEKEIEIEPIVMPIEETNQAQEKQNILACTTAVFVSDPHYSDSPLKINTEEEELKYALENYLIQLESLDADNIISMTYPRLFIPINRDIFREYLNTMVNSDDLSIVDFKASILEMNPVNCLPSASFSQIVYMSDITINFINPELYSDDKKMRLLADVMRPKYGHENIKVDTELRTISIKKEEKLLAIKENGVWSFIGDNPEYRRLYPRILPIDILNSI